MADVTLVAFIVFLHTNLVLTQDTIQIEQVCLDCICQALSECNLNVGCHINEYNEKTYCGPYYIHKKYWEEAGKPGFSSNGDDDEDQLFRKCALNKTCADETVRGYMSIYGTDCNHNKIIDCGDIFKIHQRGKSDCSEKSIESEYLWLRFLECYLNNNTPPKDALKRLIS